MSISIAQANAMLGGLSGTLYVQPHSGDPGSNGGFNVIAGALRGRVTLGDAAGGTRSSVGNVDCRGIPAGATVTHVSYWDSLGGGAFQFSEELAASVPFTYAGTLRLTSQTFSLATSSSGSQTVTSTNTDTTTASDTNVSTRIAVHTDAATAADVVGVAVGTYSTNTDTATTADSHAWSFNLRHTDTATTSDASSESMPDTTSPTISAFSVPGTAANTSLTGISASATDNVSVTGWVIKDVAGGASAPTATAAECTQTAGISANILSSSTLTHTAGGTGARDCYLFVRDAAGNVATSSVSTCTISASSAIALPNGNFESAIGSGEGDNWWPDIGAVGGGDNGVCVAERSNTSPLTGTWSGHVAAGGSTDIEALPVRSWAGLANRTTKTAIDASTGHLVFKVRPVTTEGTAYIRALVYDAGVSEIQTTTNRANEIMLWGTNTGSAANTSIKIATPSTSTTYDLDFDLAAFLASICTWGNAVKVIVKFYADDTTAATYPEFRLEC